jgi:MYXO-CTERM domain-containing protein
MKTLLALVVVGLVASTAHASDVCPKTPSWGQAPKFWEPDPATSAARKQLWVRYDGRWSGAAQVSLDNGTAASHVRFLNGGDGAIYISIEIDNTGIDREVYWIGFANDSATNSSTASLLEITVPSNVTQPNPQLQVREQLPIQCGALVCPVPGACNPACTLSPSPDPVPTFRLLRGVMPTGALSEFVWDGAAFNNTITAATWINSTTGGGRAWRGQFYTTPMGPPTGGTVMIRIPDADWGGPGDKKIWVAAAKCDFSGTGPTFCSPQGNWPSVGLVAEPSADRYTAPALTQWADLKRTAACAAKPELTTAGVQNGAAYDPSASFTYPQRIYLDKDGNLGNDPPNWFGARVAMPIPSSARTYKARFFVADWGSQIGNLDLSQWSELDPDLVANPDAGKNPGAPVAGTTENIFIRWPPTTMSVTSQKTLACKYSNCTTSNPACPYPSNGPLPDPCAAETGARTHSPHQCTQVRLESIGTTGFEFARDSMIFNTDFVGASVFWRVATINTKGIETVTPAPAPAPAEGRDIYIYVRAANLPQTSDEIPAQAALDRLEQITNNTPKPPPGKKELPEVARAREMRASMGQGGGPPPDEQRQQAGLGHIRKLPLDTARLVAPTLEFRVFYDTGAVMDTHTGKTFKWVEAMTGFGYVVEHVGKIKGWEYALDGAEPLGDNWFRIRVKDGEQQQVRTRVQAVEGNDRMPPGNPQWPPGKAWLSPAGDKKGMTKVKVKRKGGCSVGDDASPMTALLLASALWLARRRRRSSLARRGSIA